MALSFREKSAWAMGAVMVLTGLLFAYLVMQVPANASAHYLAVPFVPYVLTVIILSIIAQALLGICSPGEARLPADERERIVIDRAGHWSGYVLATAVISGSLFYLVQGNGNHLFQWLIGGMIVSQIAEYAFQISLFRRTL